MCESKFRFIYFGAVGVGKTNDNRAVSRCKELVTWLQNLPKGYFAIGDNAYTIANYLLIPLTSLQMGDNKACRAYNFYLSQLRIHIEMAFGRLTTKWRIFRRNLEGNLDRISDIIVCAAKLHNFVIDNDPQHIPELRNREYNNPNAWGVVTLPTGPNVPPNNGFLAADPLEWEEDGESDLREVIINKIIPRDIFRPIHNINRNN